MTSVHLSQCIVNDESVVKVATMAPNSIRCTTAAVVQLT